jgi:RimJ/RimL family protein N-acetyltransferase
MQKVTEADLPALTNFLRTRTPLAMFALANIARFGLRGGHPHATQFWAYRRNGRPVAVIGQSEAGMLMPHLPEWPQDLDLSFLNGRMVSGLAGAPSEVDRLSDHCGLSDTATTLAADEPLFTLSLADLRTPDVTGLTLAPLSAMPVQMLQDWRCNYGTEVMGLDPEIAQAQAAVEAKDYVAADSHRVLLRDGVPVALTGFNARLPDVVQIGGVYTPPDLRGRGHARAAVALHLAEVRSMGVTRAILFAANDAAARAYRAVGFAQIGAYRLTLFKSPREVSLG